MVRVNHQRLLLTMVKHTTVRNPELISGWRSEEENISQLFIWKFGRTKKDFALSQQCRSDGGLFVIDRGYYLTFQCSVTLVCFTLDDEGCIVANITFRFMNEDKSQIMCVKRLRNITASICDQNNVSESYLSPNRKGQSWGYYRTWI